MKRLLIAAAALALLAPAGAQQVSARLQASQDSDDLREWVHSVGYTGAAGFGLRADALRYRAPGWGESGALLAATYRSERAELPVDASLGVLRIAGHEHLVGTLEVLRPVTAATTLGLSFERDQVNSVEGISAGITHNTVALVADHAFNARFNVGLSAGLTRFSNDNRRPFLRTRWNLALDERYGVNAYLKTRSYQNSHPGRAEYFSPERLNEVSGGLSTRFVAAQSVIVSAAADLGRQHTEAGSQSIWSASVGVAAPRASRIQWRVALQASNAAGTAQASDDYRYTSLVAQLSVPF